MNVYFIISGDFKAVKIGVAKNVLSRLAQLQIANPEKLELIKIIKFESLKKAYFTESGFHEEYKNYHIRGEWFHPTVIFKGQFKGDEFKEIRKRAKLFIKLNQSLSARKRTWKKKNKQLIIIS